MSMNPAEAAQAYLSVSSKFGKAGTPQATTGQAEVGGFGDLVKAAIEKTEDMGKAIDQKGEDIANGRADIVELVTAVAETEVAVETMVTVRDRVISAYQEILNMPI